MITDIMTSYESIKNKEEIKRVQYLFSGIVQGVGFRPFIYRQALQNKLGGFVQNRPDGVLVEVEGAACAIDSFLSGVRNNLPPLADVVNISVRDIPAQQDGDFQIISSDIRGDGDVHIAPDVAVCQDCLAELFNFSDRRWRYPFINCTNCGPRLTIIQSIPYDRVNTSMSCFPLCPQCQSEYENPADRRFHAEPNACPVCGPRIQLLDQEGNVVVTDEPITAAVDLLKDGKVLAIKGLGGFHLSVDAGSDEAVRKLRSRKFREEKPLAIMVKDMETVKKIVQLNEEEEKLLASPQRPIVLLKKKNSSIISKVVAPGVSNLGVMLPYTPLHYLLMENYFAALVMTSANQVDEPICISNREAVTRLKGIADYFLIHNRDILVRCDDSIVMVAGRKQQILRRSRGFVPRPLELAESFPDVLALGPQLKATQCILKGKFAFLSPHIGDLETPQARDFFQESLALMKKVTESDPRVVACDYHPAYYSTKVAAELTGVKVIRVQHHHAHIVSCMAENHISGDVIGLAMDGTGYGLDGNAWGGEFLVANETEFKRLGHLQYFVLPGGGKAIHEPWRIGASLLKSAYGPSWPEIAAQLDIIPTGFDSNVLDKIMENKINSSLTSGLGRLFDGVAALLGVRRKVSFEGQAAMELEGQATESSGGAYPFAIEPDEEDTLILDMSATIRGIVEDILQGKSKNDISSSFHSTLAVAFAAMTKKINAVTGLERVALSGGCFQNRILLERSVKELEKAGFTVYCHSQVPTNDGGVALGQAVIVGAIVKRGV
ncbi:MAG: carbamoyltransferase HypF [Smithellaceae bacterium]